jgi:hypothetical protein
MRAIFQFEILPGVKLGAQSRVVAIHSDIRGLSSLVSGQQWRRHRRLGWHYPATRLSGETRDEHPEHLDGGKVFIEISLLISVAATTILSACAGEDFVTSECGVRTRTIFIAIMEMTTTNNGCHPVQAIDMTNSNCDWFRSHCELLGQIPSTSLR